MEEIIILKHNNKISGYYNSKILVENFIYTCVGCGFIKTTDKVELEYYKINSNIFIKKEFIELKNNNTKNNNIKNKNIKINNKVIKVNTQLYEEFSDSDITSIESNTKNNILDNDTDSQDNIDFNDDQSVESLDAEAFLQKKKEERLRQQKLIEFGQQKIEILSHVNKLKLEKKKLEEKQTKYEYDIQLYEKFKKYIIDDPRFTIPEMFKESYNLFEKLEKNNDLNFESYLENYNPEQIKTEYDDMFTIEPYAYKLPVPEEFKSDDIDTLLSAAY